MFTAEDIKKSYGSDSNSRILPGIKDVVSVKIDGELIEELKQLLLMDLNDSYASFPESYRNEIVSFSVSANLRTTNCILLAGARETRTVCVCTIHENCKLIQDSIDLSKLTGGQI